jgi:hypothetical protein
MRNHTKPCATADRNSVEQKATKGTKEEVDLRQDSMMPTNGDVRACPLFPLFPSVQTLRVPQRAES